jgi:dihydropyrimidinase
MDTIVTAGTLVTPAGSFVADVGIQDGRIAFIGKKLAAAHPMAQVIDAANKLVFPGGVDVHCHFPWPSQPEPSTDDVRSGTRAAICGGVTSVLDFVVPELGESLLTALDRKLEEVERGIFADYSAHIAVREATPQNLAQIPTLVDRGFPSFKVFMAYETLRLEDSDLLKVMHAVREAGGMLSVHAENGLLADRLTRELVAEGNTSLDHYGDSRPAVCEAEAINRVISYAETLHVPIHIHHVSTAAGARIIGLARRRGAPVSAETCPQYLTFTDDAYRAPGIEATYLIIAPPLRKETDRQYLWHALANDELSIVATDHCPYSLQQKRNGIDDFTKTPGGTAGVETRWPILFTHGLMQGRLTRERLAEVWAYNPAKRFGLYPRKGHLMVGADADMVIVDPTRSSVLSANSLHMNTDYSAYEGISVTGFPVTTILRGTVVVEDGDIPVESPRGTLLKRHKPESQSI